MHEYDLIEKMIKNFPRSNAQQNEFLSCDAEIVKIGNQLLACTIDDFSPEEDFFTDDNPEQLGHNLVVATLSDLFAAGAEPLFFLQALTLKKNVTENFLSHLTSGIQKTLEKAGCFLCGGDLSSGNNWRYTGIAMGKISNKKFIQRILPTDPQILWITGSLGDANLAVIKKSTTPSFELRIDEAQIIRKYATACIDTSSGLADAMFCLHKLRPELTIEITLNKIPFAPGLKEFSNATNIPQEAALVGGAGEYELLFATPKNISKNIRQQLTTLGITQIGRSFADPTTNGVFICKDQSRKKILYHPPCPRNTSSFEEYLDQVLKFTHDILN